MVASTITICEKNPQFAVSWLRNWRACIVAGTVTSWQPLKRTHSPLVSRPSSLVPPVSPLFHLHSPRSNAMTENIRSLPRGCCKTGERAGPAKCGDSSHQCGCAHVCLCATSAGGGGRVQSLLCLSSWERERESERARERENANIAASVRNGGACLAV